MTTEIIDDLQRRVESIREAPWYLSEMHERESMWRTHHEAIRRLDHVLEGYITYKLPNGETVTERPLIANQVDLALSDQAALAASITPSFRCESATERGKPRAAKRERIGANYWNSSKVTDNLPYWYMDLLGAGDSYHVVWPDFGAKGLPCIRRYDPLLCFPERPWRPDNPPRSLIVADQISLGSLAEDYPERAEELFEDIDPNARRATLVRRFEFYDSSEIVRVVEFRTKNGTKRSLILAQMRNPLNRPTFVARALPRRNGLPMGVYDQAIEPLRFENQIANMIVDHAADWMSSPMVEFGIENPEDYGTSAVLKGKNENAFMRRMPPAQNNPGIWTTIDSLRGSARESSVRPESRAGIVEQNIASAAFVVAIQGPVATLVAQAQRIEASALTECLSICFEVDEKFLSYVLDADGNPTDEPWKKYISGSVNAQPFAESYTPAQDIRGDYTISVEYGGAAGADQTGFEIRMNQAVINKIIPRRIAREKHSMVGDVLKAEQMIYEEELIDAGLQFVKAKAAAGDFGPGAAVVRAIQKPDADVLVVLAQLGEVIAQPPPVMAQPEGATGNEAFTQASSLARGGLPEPQTNVPGVGSFPSPAELGIPA